jgi:hypothetical protein
MVTFPCEWNILLIVYGYWAIFQLSGGCHHYRWQNCKFRFTRSTGLAFNSEVCLRATPAATRNLVLYGLIRRIDPHVSQPDSNLRRKGHRRFNRCATQAYWNILERDIELYVIRFISISNKSNYCSDDYRCVCDPRLEFVRAMAYFVWRYVVYKFDVTIF